MSEREIQACRCHPSKARKSHCRPDSGGPLAHSLRPLAHAVAPPQQHPCRQPSCQQQPLPGLRQAVAEDSEEFQEPPNPRHMLKNGTICLLGFSSRRNLYTPPPLLPHVWPQAIFKRRGGGVYFFKPPVQDLARYFSIVSMIYVKIGHLERCVRRCRKGHHNLGRNTDKQRKKNAKRTNGAFVTATSPFQA